MVPGGHRGLGRGRDVPAINDNYQYLKDSPITHPGKPIDKFRNGAVFHYGVWNFFRYLTEHYPTKAGALPKLLLDMWKNADSSRGPRKDMYSTQAINKALKKDAHTNLAKQFTLYSAATRAPSATFQEGAALAYPVKPLAGQAVLAAGKKHTFKTKLDHLTSATFQIVPAGATSKLKLKVKMARKKAGSNAIAAIYTTPGLVFQKIRINARGVGKKTVPFGGTAVAVEVTLVNASTRYRNCYRRQTPYSCSGRPVDNNLKARVQVKAS